MAVFIARERWRRQPRGDAGPDSIWVARGLGPLLVPGGATFRNRGTRQAPLAESGLTATTSAAGRAVATTSGSFDTSAIGQGQTFSRVAIITPTATGLANDGCIATSIASTHVSGAEWRVTSAGELELLESYIASIGISSGAGLVAGKTSTVGITYDGTTVRFFVDGRACGSGANARTFAIGSGLLFRLGNGVNQFVGSMSLYADFPSVVLSVALMQALTQNPWQLFRAEEVPTFYTLSSTTDGVASSAVTATASATSLSVIQAPGATTVTSTVSAASQTVAGSVAATSVTAGASSTTQALWQGVGSTTGTSSASATGVDGAGSIASGAASTTVTSTASATGQAVWAGLGAANVTVTGSGVSVAFHVRAATSTGTSTATADGIPASAFEPRAASATATAAAAATSRVVSAAIGAIATTAVAAAVSDAASTIQAVVATAAAVAVVAAVSRATWAAVGAATGTGVADGRTPQTLTASEIVAQLVVQILVPEVWARPTFPDFRVQAGPTTIHITS